MRKKRVLALFLALSMTLSSNGFTALAAENDSDVSIEADSSEETDGNTVSEESGEAGNGSSETDESDKAGGEGDGLETGNDTSGEDGESGTGGDVSDESGESGTDGNVSDESDEPGTDGDVSDEDGESETDGDVSDESDESETESDASEESEEPKADIDETEPSENVQSYEPVIRTFTDETGMVVTYNANEESTYKYVVTDGVLESVTKVVKGEDGQDVETPLSGVVELKQHDTPYHTIASDVFKGNTGIEYVILPKEVTTIEENAFSDCISLRGISLPANLTDIADGTFKNCVKLTQLSIPKALTSIGSSAFEGDTSLFMVYIKDSAYSSMQSIGDSAFKGCRRLETFGSDTQFILPGYLESIGASAFEDCRAIKKVTLPDSVKETEEDDPENEGKKIIIHSLGDSVFKNCTSLTDVTLSGEEIIPKHAFEGCINLLSVKFASGNRTVDEYAFANCSKLGEVIFSYTVNKICNYAFSGCSQLRYAEFPNAEARIGSADAFPNTNAFPLWMRGFECDRTKPENQDLVQPYALNHTNMRFIAHNASTSEYFQYTYKCLTEDTGTVTFSLSNKSTDPNKANSAKGVKAGEKIYVSVNTTSSVKLVDGSLRCNGTPISGPDSEGYYVFKMPVGGAYVTAEFENTGKDKSKFIDGTAADVEYELSNGSELKIGQTSRMFLIDKSAAADNSLIPSYKITYSSSDKTVASVSSDGIIKALKKGTAYIKAVVYDRDGIAVYPEAEIHVDEADVYELKLKPYLYDTNIITVGDDEQSIKLMKEDVEANETTFSILATAYDSENDNMSVALKWSTSDSKVAKIATASTKDTESQNKITIPKGASGEATITVTATNKNPVEADKKTVTSKFTVRVIDRAPRLSASTITLNPYHKDGAELEVIAAYDTEILSGDVYLRSQEDKNAPHGEFILTDGETSGTQNSIHKVNITAKNANLNDGNYQACIYVIAEGNSYYLPLTIKVKRSAPNPKVKFASNQAKMNFFYHNGGIEDGVKPVISNLGNDVVTGYELDNLSNSGDDAWFNKNFEISNDGIITRSDEPMYYTAKNKPVVTGYLVLKFDDYKDGYNEKRFKITIPNKTVKPSYKLERTSDTFNLSAGPQDVAVAVLDKKTKTPIDLTGCDVSVLSSSTTTAVNSADIDEAGLHMDINPSRGAGKVVLSITNEDEWDQDIQFTYNVKVSNKKTTFKLSKSSVTLNKYYAGSQTIKLTLKSNQYGIEPTNKVFETPDLEKLSDSKAEQYDYIKVEWNDENQIEVSLVEGCEEDIKNGSYKFTCEPLDENGNKVTLTVKVTSSMPRLSLKGSANLNKLAGDQDIASLTANITNIPSGYECRLDTGSTTIEYVTNKEDDMGLEGDFNWSWEEDDDKQILHVSLGSDELASKTYTFKMTPAYDGCEIPEEKVKPIKFKVKVYSKTISVSLKAKGKINLLERYYEIDPDIDHGTETGPGTGAEGSGTGTAGTASVVDVRALTNYDADNITVGMSDSPLFASEGEREVIVKVECEDGHAKVTYGDPGKDAEGTIITVDEESNVATDAYMFTASADTGYEITSLDAYDSSEKDSGWTESIVKSNSNIEEDGSKGTITIDNTVSLENIDSITIVVATAPKSIPVASHTVTVTKTDKVDAIKYKVFEAGDVPESSADLDDLYDLVYSEEDSEEITVEEHKNLVLQIEPKSGYSINEVTADFEQLDEVKVDDVENTYILEDVSADKNITIDAVEIKNGEKTVTFVHNGSGEHASIKDSTGDSAIITNAPYTITGEEYSFVVETKAGYIVDVKAYDSGDYTQNQDGATELDIFEDSQTDDSTHTILAENIDKNITIVVTDLYTVTINNEADDIVTKVSYGIGGSSTDNEYSEPLESLLKHKDSISIKLELSDEFDESQGNQSIVVKAESSKGEEVSIQKGDNHTYTIDSVTDNTEITVSLEIQYSITLDNPDGSLDKIDGFEFAVIDESDSILGENNTVKPDIDFTEYSDGIDVPDGKKLALKITIKDPHVIVNSVSYTTIAEESDELSNELSYDQESVTVKLANGPVEKLDDGSTIYYFYMEEKLPASATLSIETEDVYIITFDRRGGQTKIEVVESVESDEPGEPETKTREIDGTTDYVVQKDDAAYKFTLTPGEDCGVAEPEIYITKGYQPVDPESINKEPEDGNTYEITGINEDITIVVTDTYTVTIENATSGSAGTLPPDGNLQDLSYKVGDADYLPYEEPITVPYGEDFRFKVTPKDGRTIVVLDTSEDQSGVIFSAESEAEEASVYAVKSIDTRKSFKLVDAYNVKAEITQVKEKDTASIEYIDVEPNDSGEVTLVGKNTLSFEVTPNVGYIVSEISYYKAGAPADKVSLYNKDNVDEETDGDYKYTIESIDDDITIEVKTEVEDPNNYTVVFNVSSNVTVNCAEMTESMMVRIPKEAENRTINFSVKPDQGYKLRKVESDEGTLENNPVGSENYTFTLSDDDPAAVTNIYIEATAIADITLTFTGLTTADGEVKANVYTVDFSGEDKKTMSRALVTTPLTCKEDGKVDFIVEAVGEHTILSVTANGGKLTSEQRTVVEGEGLEEHEITLYTLDLTDVTTNVEVKVLTDGDEMPDEPDEPEKPASRYTLKNSIVYTPVISGLNDKVVAAKIFDANGRNPNYDDGEESKYFNIEVDEDTGLLYVMPKEDPDPEEEDYLKNKTTYQVKIWVELEHYKPDDNQGGIDGGLWVNKTIKIKTAQVLPKVVTDTKTPLNLYQSNKGYTASFVVTLKDGSIGEMEGIEFGEKDTKAIDSFELDTDISKDGSVMLVTLSLNEDGSPQYAVNSSNKIKMYVKFKNQAIGTTGTPITMTVKINK